MDDLDDLLVHDYKVRRAAERWGRPVGVDEARGRWSALLDEAEAGVPTLLHRSPRALAVLAPIAELYTPPIGLRPVFSTRARATLGDLVQAADAGQPQLITRRDLVFAALIPAVRNVEVAPGEQLDPDEVVRAGGRITVIYNPEIPFEADEDGNVVDGGTPATYEATACDQHGMVIGCGTGEDLDAAVRDLRRPEQESPLVIHPNPPF